MKNFINPIIRTLVLLTICLTTVSQVHGQIVTGHYNAAIFGLRSGNGFPMGWSYVNVTHFYYAGEMKDNDGKISTLAKPINVIANISGGIWGKRLEKLNANYNAALILPFTNLAPNPETLELDPERIGLGDIKIIPLLLTWNFDQISLSTRYAIWAPTGEYSATSKSNRGKGFWSHNIGLGVTGYFDKAKSWHASIMGTYEINSKQKDTDIIPGDGLILEWGLGKTFDQQFNMGLIGYSNMLVTKQKGGNVESLNNYQIHSIGMEFNYRTKTKWVFITRWYLEYLGINRPEGTVIRFIFLKNF
jgi:hypothetical protein